LDDIQPNITANEVADNTCEVNDYATCNTCEGVEAILIVLQL